MLQRHRKQRGQVLVIFAIGMTAFLGLTALVVDFGAWLQERRAYQNFADAASLVGVNHLRPPITPAARNDAVMAALDDLDRQLGLGITNLAAAAVAAQTPGGLSSATGAGYTGPDVFYVTTPPNPSCSQPGSFTGNNRAITVQVRHQSNRYFSSLFTNGTNEVSVCATASSAAAGYAVAVLKPPDGTNNGNRNANKTYMLDGVNTTVNITGGNVGVNATYAAQGNPCPNDTNCPTSPAVTRFLTDGNWMELGLPAPNNPGWTVSPPQIADPVGNYLPPTLLNPRLTIPGWGPGLWLDEFSGTYDPNGTPVTYSGPTPPDPVSGTGGACTDPAVPGVPGLRPGNYSQINLSNGQRLWLCPGVFHILDSGGGQDSLLMAQDSVLAGQGVTLVFEANAAGVNAEMKASSGSIVCLNPDSGDTVCSAGTHQDAPWTTGWSLHDVPITIWIRPVSGCDPLGSASSCAASAVFTMRAGARIRERGIIYGPTDNISLAGQTVQASSSGEVWAWTLTYAGGSTLNQTFDGPDVSYPRLVQ